MADDAVKKLTTEVEDLVKSARKAVNELGALSRQGTGKPVGPDGYNVDRPGVAGSSGSGGPITGGSGSPGHVNTSSVVATGAALYSYHKATSWDKKAQEFKDFMYRGTDKGKTRPWPDEPWVPSPNETYLMAGQGKGGVAPWTAPGGSGFTMVGGVEDLDMRRGMVWDYHGLRGPASLAWMAKKQQRAFWNQVHMNPTAANVYGYGAPWLTAGERRAMSSLYNSAKNFAQDWVVGGYQMAKDVGKVYGRTASMAATSVNATLMKYGGLAGGLASKYGPTAAEWGGIRTGAALAALYANDALRFWEIEQEHQQKQHMFQGQRPSLHKVLEQRKDAQERWQEKANMAVIAGAATAGAVVGGPIGAAIAAGVAYGAQLASRPILRYGTNLVGVDTEWGGEYRVEQETRKAAIKELFRKYSLGDLREGRMAQGKWRPLTAEERSVKYLRDRTWSEDAFRQNLQLSHEEKKTAYRRLELGDYKAMPTGEFAGRDAATLMRQSNDRIQGVCPNWWRPQQVYAMFEAGRVGARNFARAMSPRGAIRTGD